MQGSTPYIPQSWGIIKKSGGHPQFPRQELLLHLFLKAVILNGVKNLVEGVQRVFPLPGF
jgi:hypothetical protein